MQSRSLGLFAGSWGGGKANNGGRPTWLIANWQTDTALGPSAKRAAQRDPWGSWDILGSSDLFDFPQDRYPRVFFFVSNDSFPSVDIERGNMYIHGMRGEYGG